MARREDKLKGLDTSKKVDVREYKNICKERFGEKSVNNQMLNVLEKATKGRKASVEHFNQLNAKMKMGDVRGDLS